MDADLAIMPDDVGSVGTDLASRFRDVLPDTMIETAVLAAAEELRGQVPPGAFGALLHRLAAYRLSEQAAVLGRRMNE
jgi:hypothetical protein